MATEQWRKDNVDKMREYRREYYYRNREREIARVKKNNIISRKIIRDYLYDIKLNIPCIMCDKNFHPAAMDCHHREGEKKLFELAKGTERSLVAVKKELKKCDVVCSNCHRIHHYEEKNGNIGV